MQLVLSNNRVIAHGSGYLALGGVVINKTTGEKYDNATIAECENCPSDIDKVGYEYHAGVFTPCAPYGTGNNNGFFMEVCEKCATPRSSGIKIKGGLKRENFDPEFVANELGGTMTFLLWENASPVSDFAGQTITLSMDDWDYLICETNSGITIIPKNFTLQIALFNISPTTTHLSVYLRGIDEITANTIKFGAGELWTITPTGTTATSGTIARNIGNQNAKPLKIYGVKI